MQLVILILYWHIRTRGHTFVGIFGLGELHVEGVLYDMGNPLKTKSWVFSHGEQGCDKLETPLNVISDGGRMVLDLQNRPCQK